MFKLLTFLSLFPSLFFAQQLEWIKTVGFFHSTNATGVALDLDNNIYLSGCSGADNNFEMAGNFVYKFSPEGNVIWFDTIKTSSGTENAGIVTDQFGNAITAGSSNSNSYTLGTSSYTGCAFLVKYNPAGQVMWTKPLDGQTWDVCSDKLGHVYARSFNGITKFDSNGNSVCDINNGLRSVTTDGFANVYVYTSYPSILKKYNACGALSWSLASGFTKPTIDQLNNCYINQEIGPGVTEVIKLNSSGQAVWTSTAALTGECALCTDQNNDIYITGRYFDGSGYPGMKIYKFSSTGSLTWSFYLPNPNNNIFLYTPTDIITKNENIYISGYKSCSAPLGFLIKIQQPFIQGISESKQSLAAFAYPNPAREQITIRLNGMHNGGDVKLLDLFGNVVYFKSLDGSSALETIQTSQLTKGVYFLEVSSQDKKENYKLVLD